MVEEATVPKAQGMVNEGEILAKAREVLADADQKLGLDHHRGLTAEKVAISRKRFGSNELTPPKKDPLWKQYLSKFEDPTIIILSACAGLALVTAIYEGAKTGEWGGIFEAVAILIAVLIATGVGFWLEYKADQAFELLKAEAENPEVKITRDGAFHTVRSKDLVVGDLVHLESGDKIPGDGVVVHCSELRVDQSMMTGESHDVDKDAEHSPLLLAGTDVREGNASMIVAAVGDRTQRGIIARELGEVERERTPLEQKLDALADLINIAGTAAAALIFASIFGAGIMRGELGGAISTVGQTVLLIVAVVVFVGVVGYSFTKRGRERPVRTILIGWGLVLAIGVAVLFVWGTPFQGDASAFNNFLKTVFDPVLRYFMLAVTIIVVAVPEGLPMAITISLAFSMRKIREDNNLVRKMIATETLGSTTVICSDKTGTLTLNRMSVDQIYLHGQLYTDGQTKLDSHPAFRTMALISARNSTGHLEDVGKQVRFVGNPTECALLKWLRDQGVEYEPIREEVEVVRSFPFSGDRKIMSTVVSQNGRHVVLSKGAPERIMARCDSVEVAAGRIEPIAAHRAELDEILHKMTSAAMRPLALAYRSVDAGESAELESHLTLVGLVGISDPARADVPGAVQMCREAGIEVKMVTGDHQDTARVIAQKIGMMDEDSLVMTGEEFQAASDEDLVAKLGKTRVLARFSPFDKLRLVRLLKRNPEAVVAVTGDGTNDAMALKDADVGISMGLRGTDVAKEASDIVLVDDNFGSIVRAVHWGRTLYENVQKFLQFQLTINLSALVIAFLSPLLAILFALLASKGINLLPNSDFRELPLTILQLLWINLIMDTLAALALSLEPPRAELMKEPPKRRGESFITRAMAESILVMAVYFLIIILVMQATGKYLGVEKAADPAIRARLIGSVVFTTYVFLQIFNLFNARSVRPDRSAFAGVAQSRNFQLVLGLIVVVQVLLTQFGGTVFNTAPLPWDVWLKVIAIGLSGLLIGELFRYIRRHVRRSRTATAGA